MADEDKSPDGGRPTPSPGTADASDRRHSGVTGRVSTWVERFHRKLDSWGTFKAPPRDQQVHTDLGRYRTTLAVHRTLMGADRSLMAWVRTALSMVSFGFTIYKILQGMAAGGGSLGLVIQEPRTVALFLIGIGNVAIVLGILEYWQRAKDLSSYQDVPIWRPSFLIAVAIAVLSIGLLVGVFVKAL